MIPRSCMRLWALSQNNIPMEDHRGLYRENTIGHYALSFTVLLGIIILPFFTNADTASSTSFVVQDTSIGTLGGSATSTSFADTGAGLLITAGESSSTNFGTRSGPLANGFTPVSRNWRFYDDETSETPNTPLAAENISPTGILDQNIIKLRFAIKETAGAGSNNVKFKLQFSKFS